MPRQLVEIIKSDISGKDIDPENAARIVVSDHPALGNRTVELDADVSEVERLEGSKLTMVSVAVYLPEGGPPKRIILDAAAFDKLFPKTVDVAEALQAARPGVGAPVPRRRGRPASGSRAATKSAPTKIDYTDEVHFGQLHRGRVTEEEAALVRGNLEQANKQLDEGQVHAAILAEPPPSSSAT